MPSLAVRLGLLQPRPSRDFREGLFMVDSVEKLSAWLAILAIASKLARGNLPGMPPSAQMMVFVD